MSLTSLRHLLTGSLSRAGAMKSVNAAMVVEAANRVLPAFLPSTRGSDVVAVSYKNGTLHLAAKTPVARFSLKGQEAQVLAKLKLEFPKQSFDRITIALEARRPSYEF